MSLWETWQTIAVSEDGRVPSEKEKEQPLGAGEEEKMHFLLEPPEEHNPANSLILTQ